MRQLPADPPPFYPFYSGYIYLLFSCNVAFIKTIWGRADSRAMLSGSSTNFINYIKGVPFFHYFSLRKYKSEQSTGQKIFLTMSAQQPTANAMSLQATQPVLTEQQKEQQPEVMRLRGGGNGCADCMA